MKRARQEKMKHAREPETSGYPANAVVRQSLVEIFDLFEPIVSEELKKPGWKRRD